jgi:hypothetical protein
MLPILSLPVRKANLGLLDVSAASAGVRVIGAEGGITDALRPLLQGQSLRIPALPRQHPAYEVQDERHIGAVRAKDSLVDAQCPAGAKAAPQRAAPDLPASSRRG